MGSSSWRGFPTVATAPVVSGVRGATGPRTVAGAGRRRGSMTPDSYRTGRDAGTRWHAMDRGGLGGRWSVRMRDIPSILLDRPGGDGMAVGSDLGAHPGRTSIHRARARP